MMRAGPGTESTTASGVPSNVAPRSESSSTPVAVACRNVTKSFFGKPVLHNVDIELREGTVHALLGENGAGKSTLCSIMAGLYRPDSGEVSVGGVVQDFRSPSDALEVGVGMVYQHYRLVKTLTVAENLVLGHPDAPAMLSRKKAFAWAERLSVEHGIAVDPAATVGDLAMGEQQRVEILKLLGRGVRVLFLDEATAVLTPHETDQLFDVVRTLTAKGTSLVLVTHKLNEALGVADWVTILRDGRCVESMSTEGASVQSLGRAMVDRDIGTAPVVTDERSGAAKRSSTPVLRVKGISVGEGSGQAAVSDVSLDVYGGEIVGIAGVSGNGQRELADAITGLTAASGQVELADIDVSGASARERCAAGLGYIPEDRLGCGVAPGLTVEENLMLRHYWQPEFSWGPFLSRRAITRHLAALSARIEVRGARKGMPISLLSGGNIQRAMLARELGDETQALVVCSPTRGLDISVTELAHNLLRARRDAGVAIVLISEDLEEVLALSDRVHVMFKGRIVGSMDADEIDRTQIGLLMAGSAPEHP
jgi:ABC-type uncharacterized transport system ATPase subunit